MRTAMSRNMRPAPALYDLSDICLVDFKHAGYRPKRKSPSSAKVANLADFLRIQFRVYMEYTPTGSRLDQLRDPTTILGAIRSIIVDAIDAEASRWSRPHVRQKSLEAVLPPLANCDATPAVTRPRFVVRVGAAALHFGPSIVLAAIPPLPRMSVASLGTTDLVNHIAPTGLRAPVPQLYSRDYNGRPAVAVTGPPRIRSLLGGGYALDHDETPEPPSRHLDHWCSHTLSTVRVASYKIRSVRIPHKKARCEA